MLPDFFVTIGEMDGANEKEIEKYKELKTLVENLNIPVWFGALGASNAIPIQGKLPKEKEKLLSVLEEIIQHISRRLHNNRKNLRHL